MPHASLSTITHCDRKMHWLLESFVPPEPGAASSCTIPVDVFHGTCSRCYYEVVLGNLQEITSHSPMPVLTQRPWEASTLKLPRCQTVPNTLVDKPPQLMPSLARYIRGIRAVGIKEWWHQMQYIGDVKAGTFVGSDQCVAISGTLLSRISTH